MLKESIPPSITHPGRCRLFGYGLLAVLGVVLVGCQTQNALDREQRAGDGFENLLQSVVRIDVRELAFGSGSKRFVSGVGSGVILGEDGLVLTNAHVVSPRAV